MPKPKMTEQQLERAISLRHRSWSLADIADDIGLSVGCVAYQLLKAAVEAPKHRQSLPSPKIATGYSRCGFAVRRFTVAEDQLLLELEARCATVKEISTALARRHNSIRGRLMTLARREARIEEARINDRL